ncbi:MAG: hypothetical protein ACRC57_11855 [Sarcina sp.]
MEKKINLKTWGVGSVSLVLAILGVMFSFTEWGGKSLGGHFFYWIGIEFPTMIISLILLGCAVFIGYKYKENYLAKTGKIIAKIFIVLMLVLSIISIIMNGI